MVPTSSGLPERTDLPSAVTAVPPAAVCTWPKAPNRTLASERPIAWLISVVSNVPDAPTSVPATIKAKLLRTNPLAATESPVKALRREITTGMSAPPIGMTKATPSTSASRSSGMKKTACEPIARFATASATIAIASRALTTC